MSPLQLQRRVVLPLALPVIIAGLRVVTVTTIGIATIAPIVSVEDIGYLMFQGLNVDYPDQIVAGVIIISALAIAADLLLLGLQALLSRGRQIVPAG
jgi:osmoprotectant transport system permease protein